MENLPTARILLLVNYRPEYQHTWGNRTYYLQLRIDPLPPERADELLRALLGEDLTLEPLTTRTRSSARVARPCRSARGSTPAR
jgi:hypothetical protein